MLREHRLRYPILPAWKRLAGNAKCLAFALDGRATHDLLRTHPKLSVADLDAKSLLHALLEGRQPAQDLDEARRTLAFALAAARSAAEEREVALSELAS